MEQLQLRDIAGYLPYGLQVEYELRNGAKFSKTVGDCQVDAVCTGIPLLLPLSCLIEQIEHKGKTIVPIVELAMIEGVCGLLDRYTFQESSQGYSIQFRSYEFAIEVLDSGVNIRVLSLAGNDYSVANQRAMWDFLDELHIDYRNLIGRGLAKDKRLFNNK